VNSKRFWRAMALILGTVNDLRVSARHEEQFIALPRPGVKRRAKQQAADALGGED